MTHSRCLNLWASGSGGRGLSGDGVCRSAEPMRRRGIVMAVPRSFSFFTCANCGALYQVVRGSEAGPESINAEIACRSCGGPMPGRAGQSAIKYFHLREATRRSLREKGKQTSKVKFTEASALSAAGSNSSVTLVTRG